MNQTIIVWVSLATASIVWLSAELLASGPAVNNDCSGPQITQAVAKGDLDRALTITEHCIETEKADFTSLGTFLVVKPEILALKGALSSADSALADAEKFDQQHPHSIINWREIEGLPAARAFVLEKKGDLNGAAAAYEKILKHGKESGAAEHWSIVQGRLAVIALERGDYTAAERWSKDVLATDPAANVAFAAVLEHQGNAKRAKEYYAAALKMMAQATEAAKSGNWLLPIYFAEQQRARNGVNK